ncbi:MAG: hypothetical protein A2X78_03250 [Gammaproteobacteria bacterium GWE2_37_16]|nr:MAG: hypothetical protein A2X78_03250 [Gammaproteobacteria bacterium GWE2_37_16]
MPDFSTVTITTFLTIFILSVIVWLFRSYISSWINYSIKHKYDKELEELRAIIRKGEEERKSISQAVMTAFSVVDSAVKTYRLNAINKLWNIFLDIKKLSSYVTKLALLDEDFLPKNLNDNPKLKLFIDTLFIELPELKNNSLSDKYSDGEATRLWVSPIAWSLYLAYIVIVSYVITQITMLKFGIYDKKLLTEGKILKILKVVMPEITSVNNKKLPLYLEKLEFKLIDELQRQILNHESDQESINRAKIAISLYQDFLRDDEKQKTNGMIEDLKKQ